MFLFSIRIEKIAIIFLLIGIKNRLLLIILFVVLVTRRTVGCRRNVNTHFLTDADKNSSSSVFSVAAVKSFVKDVRGNLNSSVWVRTVDILYCLHYHKVIE